MIPPATDLITNNESGRLDELLSLNILDTDPEIEHGDISELAAHICDTPMAIVSLIDEKRQWLKSKVGLTSAETPRGQSPLSFQT